MLFLARLEALIITRYFCLSHCRAFQNSKRYYTKYYRNIIWFRTWNIQFFQDWICTFYMYTYLLNALVFEWSVECRDGFVSWNLIFGYLEWVEKGFMPENCFIPVLTFEKSSNIPKNKLARNVKVKPAKKTFIPFHIMYSNTQNLGFG